MISKLRIPAVLFAMALAVSASGTAFAGEHRHHGGDGLAIAAGIIGAVAIGSLMAGAASAPSHTPPQPVYRGAPEPLYYQPAPVYVRPVPVYRKGRYHRDRPRYRPHHHPYREVYYVR